MFKYTIVIAAVAVTASLAATVSVTEKSEPTAASSNMVTHKRHHRPENIVFVQEVTETPYEGKHGSGLIEAISLPKKLLGFVGHYLMAQIKSTDAKKLFKGTLLGAFITVLGAVAAVALAGLASLISGLTTLLPYMKILFSHKFHNYHHHSDSHVDKIGEFLSGAINKYHHIQHGHHKA